MVFESIVVDILNKFLGDYVENLDRSQLKIGIWGGDVSLKNLSLKPSALDDLNLPVKTVYGHLGKLVLKIPWKNIYTAPVEVFVENLFLLVNPIQDVTYDAEKEEKFRQEAKQAMLSKVEEAKKKEKEKGNQQVNDTFVEKLAAQIIKNVQVFIGDIHVRYEDRVTKPDSPFSIGISLHTLKIYTTNECCENYVVPENESPLFYKIMVMEGLTVYWNTDASCFANAEYDNELMNKLFVEGIASKTHQTVGYNYILGPINSDAKLQVNSKPELLNFITPKIFLSLVLEQLLLNLRKSQYQDLIALLGQFDRMTKAAPFRKYRPDLRQYEGHYKEWWRFAITCTLDDVKRKSRNWDWSCIKQHRQLCKQYVSAYRRKLTEKPNEPATKTLEQLERDLDAFNIVLIRQQVENEVEREGRFSAEQKAMKKSGGSGGGWFGGWFSSSSKSSAHDQDDQNLTSNIVKQFGNAMTEEEKQKLYRAIDYHESLIPTLFPPSFVAIRLEFVLKVLKIRIIDDDDDDFRPNDGRLGGSSSSSNDNGGGTNYVMTVQFKEVLASISQRPAAQSFALSLTMQSFETLGMQQRGIVPKIIRSKLSTSHEHDDNERRYFLDVFFETNPQDGQFDQRLHVTLRPLKVVYDAQTVIKILQVFTPQNDITTVKNQIQAAANTKFEEMKERSTFRLQYAIEKSAKLDLKVDLMAPYLILPFGGFYTSNEMALVINLGRITVVSKNRDNAMVNVKRMLKEGSSEDQVFSEMMSKCYDCFRICLGEVQVLSLKAGQKWKPLIGGNDVAAASSTVSAASRDSHILQPTSVYVDIYKCVIDDDPRLPKIKIDGSLPDVTVKITEKTLLEVVSLIISLPLPSYSDETSITAEHADTGADDDDDASTIYDSAASLRQKLESLNRLQFSTLKKYGKTSTAAASSRNQEHPTSSTNRMPNVDYINLEANFSLQGLTVYVQRESMENALIEASVNTLQLSFVQRTYSCQLSAKLGKLSLLQNYMDSIVPAISTPVGDDRSSQQYLFFSKLTIAEKNSPVFETLYNSTAVQLAVEFTKLYAIAHQDAIMDTIRWIGELQARVLAILSKAANSGGNANSALISSNSTSQSRSQYSAAKLAAAVAATNRRKSSAGSAVSVAVEKKSRKLKTKSALAAIVEDQLSDLTGSHSHAAAAAAAPQDESSDGGTIIEFQVIACLDEIQVCLQTARASLASMYVNGLRLSTRIDKTCTEIDVDLHSISVYDLNAETIYNKIAYIAEGKRAFKAVVTLHNDHTSDTIRSENDFDVSVKVQMSSLHCVFINQFIVNVLHFANNFQTSKKMLAEVSAAAVASAKMNVQQVYQSSTRVLLDVFVDAPVIMIPRNSRSGQIFIVDFGNLSVKNTLKKLSNVSASLNSPQHAPLIDQVFVVLKDMKIIRTNYERTDPEHTLLKPVNYQLVVERNLSVAWFDQVADFDIRGEFCPIHITITAHDYDVVMKTLQENLGAETQTRDSDACRKDVRQQQPPSAPQPQTRFADEQTSAATNAIAANDQDAITMTEADCHVVSEADEQRVRTMLKFEMTIESVTIDLYTVSNDDNKDGLAKFTVSLLSVNGSLLTDTRLAVHASLSNCCLDDTRSSKIANPVKRYMERKSPATSSASARNMVDVNFEKDFNHTNVNAHVYSFLLILNVDHITKIQEFFSPQSFGNATSASAKKATASVKRQQDTASSLGVAVNDDRSATVSGLASIVLFSLVLEKPDIILVENLDDIDTNAIILNNEANVRLQISHDNRLTINAVLRDLQLYTCCYNPEKRHQSAALIVHPLSIDVNGASSENGNLHLDVNVSQVNVSITAGTIALLTNISSTLVPKMEDESGISESSSPDFSDVWNQKPVKEGYWFLEMEEAEDALLAYANNAPPSSPLSVDAGARMPNEKRVDLIVMAIPVVRVTLEAGVGKKTIPLLALNSSLRASVRKTVEHLTLESYISLEIGYYNTRLAMWEPIIEPILQPCADSLIKENCVPWKLQFQCKMLNRAPPPPPQQNDDCGEKNTDENDAPSTVVDSALVKSPPIQKEPLLSLRFTSEERIEVTFTKTCIDVVKTLSQSFNDVMRVKRDASTSCCNVSAVAAVDDEPDAAKSRLAHEVDGSSCYALVNEFGVDVQLSLTEGQPFKLISVDSVGHSESSELASSSSSSSSDRVIVPRGCTVRLSKKKLAADVDGHAAGGNRLKDEQQPCLLDELNTIKQRDTDFLRVTILCRNKELALPVCRADKRYFAVKSGDGLNETWGLISEVDVVEGSVIATIRSVVRVYNHFNVEIVAYSMKNDRLDRIGKVGPSQYLNVPVEAVYNSKGYLFFAPEGYSVSTEPIIWKDLQKTVSLTKQVCCISKNSENEDPFFIRILGQMEQVYYENTTCYTVASTAYSIRLRPTLILKNFLPVEVVCCLQGIAAEHRLQPGQNINVCTAEPDHSTIVLRLDNYLDKVWSCKKLIKSDAPIFSVWTFTSFDSEKAFTLNLGVWYSNCDDSMIFALYCPYWMVNKSGLNLSYKGVEDGGMILHHPASFEEPILFSFKEKSFFSKKKACVRVGDGEWSDKFSMDVAGNSGSVSCSYSQRIYQLGVYIRLNYNTLTKQVIFSPFFTVANNCPIAVELRESRIRNAAWIRVDSGACIPFWPIAKEDVDKVLELRIANTNEVTASFSYLKIATHTLKLYNSFGGLQADVQVNEGGVYLALASFQPKMATALIINDTDSSLECAQVDVKSNTCDRNGRLENCANEIVSLKAKHQVLFNWSAANMDNPALLTNASASHIDLRTDGIGELRKLDAAAADGDKKYWISFLNGMQRVLLFTSDPYVVKEIEAVADFEQTQQEIQLDLKGVGFSLVNNVSKQELLYVSISSSAVVWEVQKQSGKRFKPANDQLNRRLEEAFVKYRNALRVAENDESVVAADVEIVLAKDSTITVNFGDGYIIKPSVKKIRRTYNNGLWCQIRSSERYKQIHAKINRLQVDNQIYDCVFPVIFSPIPPPKSMANTGDDSTSSARERPFAELSIVQRVDENAAAAVKQFKYFKVLVQEFHVKIDIGFVNALVKFLEADCVTDDEELAQFQTDQNVYKEPLGVHISSVTSQDFYDLLHFSPLKIHVSFSLCGENPNDGSPQQGLPIVNLLTQSVGVTLTDVNDVVFRLAYFERKHTFYSQSQLMAEVKTHYIGQFVKQLYVLVLGLDVLGNPFGLVTGLKQGVEDFFYEPFQGAIQGPSEFAEGVLLGVRSLFGHTVGGAAGAVGRITGAMGKGIAALTLDEEYQKKRRQRLAQQQTSFAEGGRGLVMGVFEGVGGVISKPISGAKEEGVEGFVKGVGKGMVGLFMRPASGVVDFASGTVDVVRRVTTFSEEVSRYRLPRYFKENGLVVPYSQKDAQGIKLLLNTEKGKFTSTDNYVFHLPMADSNQPDKEVLLVTNNRVIYLVKSSDIFSDNIKIEWQYTWNEIKEDGIAESEYGVSIRVDSGDSRRPVSSPVGAIGSLFKRTSKGKILIVSDKDLRKWLIVAMKELVRKAHRSL